jgi:diketogulonate reductase-like aldo/keto reductase
VNREDIFIVSKLFDTKDGREVAVSVIKESLKLLGFQYFARAKSSFEKIFPQKL